MTKIMELSEIVTICEQKKQTGDINTLAKMLRTSTDATRMRLSRKDEKAYRALYQIIEQRDQLIENFQNL